MKLDSITLAVMNNRLAAIADEMGVVLGQTAFSPNIKERHDFSCAIFDARGELVAQAAHIPVHLGSTPLSVRAAIANLDLERGDVAALNDPFAGGTHLPDLTLVAPVFIGNERRPFAYAANRAHHADIGGIAPGSMALATEIYQEGFRLPPVKIVDARRDRARRDDAVSRQHARPRGARGRPARADRRAFGRVGALARDRENVGTQNGRSCDGRAEGLRGAPDDRRARRASSPELIARKIFSTMTDSAPARFRFASRSKLAAARRSSISPAPRRRCAARSTRISRSRCPQLSTS